MNNNRWVIGIDLDGTLVRGREYNETNKVTPLTRKVLHAMYEKGHIVCINTGRGIVGTDNLYKDIGLPNPIINFAGAHIHNPEDQSFSDITIELNKEALIDLLENDKYSSKITGISYDTPSISYFDINDNALYELKDTLEEHGSRKYSDEVLGDINNRKITAVNVMYETDDKEIWTIVDELHKKYNEHFHVVDWISKSANELNVFGIEINAANAAKGSAVLKVAEHYGIPKENTMGIGDSPNDRDLMTTPAVGVAMKNSRPEIIELSDYVTEYDNVEEGVAKFLIEWFKLDIEY